MEVLVFKTDVTSKRKISKVRALLTAFPAIQQWNFDLEDCDKVLRIVATDLQPRSIESLLHTAGFSCREMDY